MRVTLSSMLHSTLALFPVCSHQSRQLTKYSGGQVRVIKPGEAQEEWTKKKQLLWVPLCASLKQELMFPA